MTIATRYPKTMFRVRHRDRVLHGDQLTGYECAHVDRYTVQAARRTYARTGTLFWIALTAFYVAVVVLVLVEFGVVAV